MPRDEQPPGPPERTDPRAAALARYLRGCAASFSLSADVTGAESTADAGMALLDAAAAAEAMSSDDPRVEVLSEAGLFESMPHGEARFLETPRVRAAIRRPLVSGAQAGEVILTELVAAVTATDEPREGE